MSQWSDRIVNHPVWQQLTALGPSIDQARAREELDAQTVDGLERIRAVLAFVGKRLATADPFTTHPAPLDALATALQNATVELQAFVANGSVGHVTNANTHADTALLHLAQLAVPGTPEELAGLRDAATAYRVTLEEQLAQAATISASVRSDAESLKANIDDLAAQITGEKQRLSQLTSDFQGQFSAAQETRNREFTEAQTARQDRSAALITEFTQHLAEQNADLMRQKELVLEELQGHKAHVEALVGVIGNLGVTSGYLKAANHARKTVWVWQAIAVLAMGGLIIFAYKVFIPIVQESFTWPGFAGKALLTLTVGVLAAYAANQADKSLEVERRNRKMAVELQAIGPYLATLPKERQDQFRIELGERSFGRDEGGLGRRSDKSPATVVDLLVKSKAFRDFLTDIVKAARQG